MAGSVRGEEKVLVVRLLFVGGFVGGWRRLILFGEDCELDLMKRGSCRSCLYTISLLSSWNEHDIDDAV